MSASDDPKALAEAQQAEYGTYVAAQAIFYNGARAFNANDPVPASHVEQFGYLADKLVYRVGDKPPVVEDVAQAAPPQGDPIHVNPAPEAASAPEPVADPADVAPSTDKKG